MLYVEKLQLHFDRLTPPLTKYTLFQNLPFCKVEELAQGGSATNV